MAIGYTEVDFVNGVAPALNAANMNHIDEGVKACADALDLETVAGKAITQAADAAAQRTLLNVENAADVTDEANVTAIENATAEVTAAPSHWNVLVGGAKKRLTHAGFAAIVKAFFGFVANAVGFEMAGGTTSKKLIVDENATISTLVSLKFPTVIEAGTATTTPNDTDVVPGIKADHTLLKYTWANLKAAIKTAMGITYTSGTLTIDGSANTSTIPTANEKTRLSDIQAATGATTALKLANLVTVATDAQQGVSELATAAEIVTGTDDTRGVNVKQLRDSLALADMWLTKRTKMPDGATAVYSQDAWATIDGWDVAGLLTNPATVGSGRILFTRTGTGLASAYRAVSGLISKTLCIRYKTTAGYGLINVCTDTGVTIGGTLVESTEWIVAKVQLPISTGTQYIFLKSNSGVNAATFEIDWIWIGDYSMLDGSMLLESARMANELAVTPGVPVAASGTITATDVATATKGDTIAGKKYTFVAALTASPGVEGEVLKGATKEDDLENLNLAISEAARTNNGTKYWAAAVHPLVSSSRTNAILTLTAKTTGLLGNQITVACESGTNHTASGSTLSGGKDAVGGKIQTQMQTLPASTTLYGAALLAADGGTTAGTVVQGNDARMMTAPTTWTPIPMFGGVADDGTYTVEHAKYVKAGKKVSGDCVIKWTAKGSKTGTFTLAGLPAAGTSPYSSPAGNLSPTTDMTGLTAGTSIIACSYNAAILTFKKITTTTVVDALTDANFTNTTRITVHFEYISA